jgi:hypothetical protein
MNAERSHHAGAGATERTAYAPEGIVIKHA